MKTKTKTQPKIKVPSMTNRIIQKQQSFASRDVADWKWAQMLATATQYPKNYLLQDVFSDVANDALLSSQINNRREQTISAPFEMVTQDLKVDDKMTALLAQITPLTDIMGHIWDSEWYGYSLVELSNDDNNIQQAKLINRRNVVPQKGRFYPDTSLNTFINYRDNTEYGKSILEFNADSVGLLNKSVPHILFKKFAQSCWSELCEIYGIPPRVMKTETNDPAMLNRAESMMKDMGAAAWFIIDRTEEFQFAQGVNTNGDVYANLISLCNNEISMLTSGAIIGQDTKNGSNAKEKTSLSLLDRLAEADKRMTEMYMNSIVIPAFIRMGWLPSTTSRFRFSAVENTDALWEYTQALLPYKEVDNDFIEEKFGIKIKDKPLGF